MDARCLTCGRQGSLGTEIRELSEIAFGEGQIRICVDCLNQRETKRWNAQAPQGEQLLAELPSKSRFVQRRYSYLVEPEEDIHLVRLHQDWVQDHLDEPDPQEP